PYIGHPADKAMGARSGYTLATGLVIGVGAMVGGLSILVTLLPEAAVAPILVFIGLAITAQAFLASPPRHGPAVAITFVPVAAAVVLIQLGGVLAALGKSPADLRGDAALTYRTLLVLGNGFILTAVLWGWAVVTMIDRRFLVTAAVLAVASLATLVGLVHSPLPAGALFWPWAEGAPSGRARRRARRGGVHQDCERAQDQGREPRPAAGRPGVRRPHHDRQAHPPPAGGRPAAAGRHHLDRRRRQGSARSLPRRGREPPDGADRRARQAHGQMTRPGTEAQPLRVAIVGAGPAGFYATDQLFRTPGLVVEVDMYDRVPTPYGLVRAGVAPDHQKIKAVTAAFDKVAANPAFRFFGGVELGR